MQEHITFTSPVFCETGIVFNSYPGVADSSITKIVLGMCGSGSLLI